MTRRTPILVLALVASALSVVPHAVADDDPGRVARGHLRDDAHGRITVDRDAQGRVTFVGSSAQAGVDNPEVGRGDSVTEAGRAHLDRYGAALGAARGSQFVQRQADRTEAGVDVVRYAQEVSGVPVLGGEVVISLARDRELRSLVASVAPSARVTAASVSAREVEGTALGLVRRAESRADLTVTDQGRWVLDPDVAHLTVPGGVRTVRRLEVGDGAGIRRMILVDDHGGGIVADVDLIADVDRVICDRNNTRAADTVCTSPFARIEGQGPTGSTDVNNAFDLSGIVSDFYQQVADIDLTQLLGVDVSGVKKLASTVRFCPPTVADGACPYDNAFWNGQQMFYGDGWAGADDVVGHEMTHGVIDQFSKLFYWGQSGAINESMADIIGEIIDHRHPSAGDAAGNWDMGEDLTGFGPFRSLADPTAHGQPDRMTSSLYTADASYDDSGGVHQNSGVGNKTAYLISQGGAFNGQTITGIDVGDPTLDKTATLYLEVIESLPSGADYATLARILDQSCADLLAAGTTGFTAATCTAVHQAGLATELTTNPPKALHAADAATSCPAGTSKRVLLDSETAPATKFAPVLTGWSRESTAGTANATSGPDSWYGEDPGGKTPSSAWIQTNPLRSSSSIALPAGQQSFLSFENWYVFDYDADGFYDGGTVEVGVDGGVPAAGSTLGADWVNGPERTIADGSGNTGHGLPAYSGDSHGWAVSRLNLTPFAGHTVRPQFTVRTDNQFGFIGWYLDDIVIYTCDGPAPSAPAAVSAAGSLNAMTVSWGAPTVNPAAVTAYQVAVSGLPVQTVSGSSTSVTVAGLPISASSFVVTVLAVGPPGAATAGVSITVPRGYPSIAARRRGARVVFRGSVRAAGTPLAGGVVKIQRKVPGGWRTVRSVSTRADGTYTTAVRRPARAYYRAVFVGSVGAVGTASARHRW
jgi:bacillolysin